jgi:hypothetical protein
MDLRYIGFAMNDPACLTTCKIEIGLFHALPVT